MIVPVSQPGASGSTPADRPVSPPAQRHRPARWRDPRLVVGVALVALSALGGSVLLGDDDRAAVWVAGADLAEGRRLAAGDLVRREVGFGSQAEADRYVSADTPVPPGSTLARAVGAGELLPRAALLSGEADEVLEVPLTVPAESVPGTVGAGSVVDVWVTPDPLSSTGRQGQESELVLAGVPVVALSRSGGALGPAVTRQVVVGLDRSHQGVLPRALALMAAGSVVLVRTS